MQQADLCFAQLVRMRNCCLTLLYGQKIPPEITSRPHVIFSGICRAIPQTLVAQKLLRLYCSRKKKKLNGNSGSSFLADNMQLRLLKVAGAAAAAGVSIPGW